jgi:IMP dehydrogenase
MKDILTKDVMLKQVYTIYPEDKIALARLRMLRNGIGALPVVDEDNILVGIITLRDTDFVGAYGLSVGEMMTTDVIWGVESNSMSEIVNLMLEENVERLPIIDKEGKLVGLITQTVILKLTKKLIEA